MSYKNFLAYLLTLVVGLSMTACPDDSCDDTAGGTEAGAMEATDGGAAGGAEECEEGGTGGMAGNTPMGATMAGMMGGMMGGAEEVVVYDTIVIVDTTLPTNINDDGTPGVDICDVVMLCDNDMLVNPESKDGSITDPAGGDNVSVVCDGNSNDNCVCDEAVPGICGGTARNDINNAVDADDCDADPDSYVSMGIGGHLTFVYDDNLSGCDLYIQEKLGMNTEGYTVYLCPTGFNYETDYSDVGEECVKLGDYTSEGDSGVADAPFSLPESDAADSEM